jgi:UDP-N-acetylmuramyl pentapeptide phosphotransferase/UDP-N-acetylglucosamine-1-phosphate transferase
MLLALAGLGAVLGFFLWNFPAGLIFLGDGGAYFLGFFVAEMGIVLLARNPEVSPLFPLLVCIYPAFETLFSIYRRVVVRGRPPSMPDGIHLHSLVFKRLMRWAVGSSNHRDRTRRTGLTTLPLGVVLAVCGAGRAVLGQHAGAGWFLLAFVVVYVALHSRIVRSRRRAGWCSGAEPGGPKAVRVRLACQASRPA